MNLTTSLSALMISETGASSAACAEPPSAKTDTSASLAGRNVAIDASATSMVQVPTTPESSAPFAFKAKFGRLGEVLADALPSFSIDLVSIVAGYLLLPEFVKEADTSVHDKFDQYLPALNEEGKKKRGLVLTLCRENKSSILQEGKLCIDSEVVRIYSHVEKPGIVLCVKTGERLRADFPGETYILLSEDVLMTFITDKVLKEPPPAIYTKAFCSQHRRRFREPI